VRKHYGKYPQNQYVKKDKKTNMPLKHLVDLNQNFLENILLDAPKRNSNITSKTVIFLPTGDGKLEKFTVYDNPVISPELAAKHPEIKSYFGIGIDNPKARVYFSHSPLGFKSMTLYSDKSALFIEPVSDDLNTYTVYKKSDNKKSVDNFECNTKHDAPKK
jgi:hypothetical protein